jgi:hypothetical protein
MKYLEARWLPSLRHALHQFGTTLQVDNNFIPRLERTDNLYIMDIAANLPEVDDTTLRIINCCRLYLHITTVSEMLEASGGKILPQILSCKRPPWFDPNTNVTIQQRPSCYQIRKRWKTLCTTISRYQIQGPSHLPLRLRRETYCSCRKNDEKKFFHWYASSYWECTALSPSVGDRVEVTLLHTSSWSPMDTNDAPLQAHARVRHTVYTHSSFDARLQLPDDSHAQSPTFSSYIATLDNWKQQLLSDVRWIKPQVSVITSITTMPPEVPLMVVSDGSSLENQHMSYGVTIGTTSGVILVEIAGIALGPPSSHREELVVWQALFSVKNS